MAPPHHKKKGTQGTFPKIITPFHDERIRGVIYYRDEEGPHIFGPKYNIYKQGLENESMAEMTMRVLPVGRVVKGGSFALKLAGTAGLDAKFLGGALTAIAAGMGFEYNKQNPLENPFGQPELTPKEPAQELIIPEFGIYRPEFSTPSNTPMVERVPIDFLKGRTLTLQQLLGDPNKNPLQLKTDTSAVGSDTGSGAGSMPGAFNNPNFPKFGEDYFHEPSPATIEKPIDSNKSPARSYDQIPNESNKPFDFYKPKDPITQEKPATTTKPGLTFQNPTVSVPSPTPSFPAYVTPINPSQNQNTSFNRLRDTPDSSYHSINIPKFTTIPQTSTVPINVPQNLPSNTPSIPDYARGSLVITQPEYTNPDSTKTRNSFDFPYASLNQSNPNRKGRTRVRLDLPDLSKKGKPIQTSLKASGNWAVKNPVPAVIFGKTPTVISPKPKTIKTLKPKEIKLPRFKL